MFLFNKKILNMKKKIHLIYQSLTRRTNIRLKIYSIKKFCIFKNSTKNSNKNLFHLGFDSIENSIRFVKIILECNKIFKILNETLKISKK